MIKFYGDLVGPYPYEDLTVVSSEAMPVGGVELPQVVLASRLVTRLDDLPHGLFEYDIGAILSHEVAHQWFFGMIGNDEPRDTWIDESFACYLSRRWLERPGAPEARCPEPVWRGAGLAEPLPPVPDPAREPVPGRLRQELNGLDVAPAAPIRGLPFGQVVPTYYNRGPMVIEMLRLELGEEAFNRFLRGLYARRFQNLDTADVQAEAERAAGRSLQTFFDTWVRGRHGHVGPPAGGLAPAAVAGREVPPGGQRPAAGQHGLLGARRHHAGGWPPGHGALRAGATPGWRPTWTRASPA